MDLVEAYPTSIHAGKSHSMNLPCTDYDFFLRVYNVSLAPVDKFNTRGNEIITNGFICEDNPGSKGSCKYLEYFNSEILDGVVSEGSP